MTDLSQGLGDRLRLAGRTLPAMGRLRATGWQISPGPVRVGDSRPERHPPHETQASFLNRHRSEPILSGRFAALSLLRQVSLLLFTAVCFTFALFELEREESPMTDGSTRSAVRAALTVSAAAIVNYATAEAG
jgi:hypothetical protein